MQFLVSLHNSSLNHFRTNLKTTVTQYCLQVSTGPGPGPTAQSFTIDPSC